MYKVNQVKVLISSFLSKNVTWKHILMLLGLIIVFNFLIFPLVYPTNQDTVILDTQFSYSSDKAYTILAEYNKEELKEYGIGVLTVDFVYPIIYSLFLCFLIYKLSNKKTIAMLSLIMLFSDYAENLGIVTIINYYPQKLPCIVSLSSLFTSLKWTTLVFLIITILVLMSFKIFNYKKKS